MSLTTDTIHAHKTGMSVRFSPAGLRWGVTLLQADTVPTFQVGDYVHVSGVSKGKGFAGVVKRHHFAGGSRTHGQSDRERAPGSSSSGTRLGRLFKGKRMAGRMGHRKVTVENLQVVEVDADKKIVVVKGAVPGHKATLLTLAKAV